MNLKGTDFLRAPSPPLMGWCLLVAGLAALAVCTTVWQRWASEMEQQRQEQEARLEVSRAALQPAVVTPPTAVQHQLQQARDELNRPWVGALEAIETVTIDPVYLLSLSFERGSDVLRLEAEANSFEEALGYVQKLAQTTPLRDAVLLSHAQTTNPRGLNVVRFSVVMRWTSK